jgi:hypothetical protein
MKSILPEEAVVFKAFVDERFREKVWPHVTNPSFFVNRVAVDLSKSIVLNFSDGAPKGPAINWISKLPEEDQQFFTDLDFDAAVQELNEQYVDDSIKKMDGHSKSRELDLEKSNIVPDDVDSLMEYFNKLKRHKGIDDE